MARMRKRNFFTAALFFGVALTPLCHAEAPRGLRIILPEESPSEGAGRQKNFPTQYFKKYELYRIFALEKQNQLLNEKIDLLTIQMAAQDYHNKSQRVSLFTQQNKAAIDELKEKIEKLELALNESNAQIEGLEKQKNGMAEKLELLEQQKVALHNAFERDKSEKENNIIAMAELFEQQKSFMQKAHEADRAEKEMSLIAMAELFEQQKNTLQKAYELNIAEKEKNLSDVVQELDQKKNALETLQQQQNSYSSSDDEKFQAQKEQLQRLQEQVARSIHIVANSEKKNASIQKSIEEQKSAIENLQKEISARKLQGEKKFALLENNLRIKQLSGDKISPDEQLIREKQEFVKVYIRSEIDLLDHQLQRLEMIRNNLEEALQ